MGWLFAGICMSSGSSKVINQGKRVANQVINTRNRAFYLDPQLRPPGQPLKARVNIGQRRADPRLHVPHVARERIRAARPGLPELRDGRPQLLIQAPHFLLTVPHCAELHPCEVSSWRLQLGHDEAHGVPSLGSAQA
ncbi:unnamed protein product [Cuscuta epithymum]|uniref:Uncharacterized protein n=1 Tax=Cuscuta epithymum TaxID=186058 RepID=A0AAV0GA24_9ASTE|nr:unnamed protein product [Cuscuta epithymum]